MHNYTHLRFVHSNKRHKRSEYNLGKHSGVYEKLHAYILSLMSKVRVCGCVNVCVGMSVTLRFPLSLAEKLWLQLVQGRKVFSSRKRSRVTECDSTGKIFFNNTFQS